MESRRQPALHEVYRQAGMRTPDGMPLVWISHWRGQPQVKRVYGPDLMTLLCSDSDYRHFLYGGSEQSLSDLANNLQQCYPNFNLVGQISPPFRELTPDEDKEHIHQMNASQPDIIWVGLGTPRQDFWMHQHRSELNASVLIGVGAAFDFLSGHKQQAPHWMQRNGLEWLFRLITEPRRLWRRYLIDNPLFVVSFVLQTLHLRRYNMPDNRL
jgi:N-acetylglucosaminyldiphosphoundecaprenol N-acetyl-beta-D-mannosaminyltransferase